MHGYIAGHLEFDHFNIGDTLTLNEKEAFHLIKVLRAQVGEKIVILNKKGALFYSVVTEVSKKVMILKIINKEIKTKNIQIDLLLGSPKRETFEEIIRIGVELGISTIFRFQTHYSQKWNLNLERIENIIESAMIQSNNPFYLQVTEGKILDEALIQKYDQIIYFTEKKESKDLSSNIFKKSDKIAFLIGPEGGLTNEEEIYLIKNVKNISFCHLEANLLRCPTAVATGFGFILSKIEQQRT